MLKQPAQVVFTSHRRLTSPSSVAPLTSLAGRPERPVDLRQHATARAIATVTSGTARQHSSYREENYSTRLLEGELIKALCSPSTLPANSLSAAILESRTEMNPLTDPRQFDILRCRQGTWHHSPPDVARDRRRGNRIGELFSLLHLLTAAFGTKRTCMPRRFDVRFRGAGSSGRCNTSIKSFGWSPVVGGRFDTERLFFSFSQLLMHQ